MTDREKVIRGLECCTKDECECCPYENVCFGDDEVELFDTLERDALALLKAQEPMMVEERTDTNTINCPKCGQQFARVGRDKSIYLDTDEEPNYCPKCGRAVKWE